MGLARARRFWFIVLFALMPGSSPVSVGQQSPTAKQVTTATPNLAVGPQYDSAHVYVNPEDFDRFVASVTVTFGGTTSKQVVTTVTPTPSSTTSQIISTPVGMFSVFALIEHPSRIPLARNEPATW